MTELEFNKMYKEKDRLVKYVGNKYLHKEENLEDFVQDFYLFYLENKERLYDPKKGTDRIWFNTNLCYFAKNRRSSIYKKESRETTALNKEPSLFDSLFHESRKSEDDYRFDLIKNSDALSTKETLVLELLIQGHNMPEIGHKLSISRWGVNLIVRRIAKKIRKRYDAIPKRM